VTEHLRGDRLVVDAVVEVAEEGVRRERRSDYDDGGEDSGQPEDPVRAQQGAAAALAGPARLR
jgi:hypothetical protein